MASVKAVFVYGKASIQLEGPADEIQRCLESGTVSEHLMKAASSTKSEAEGIDDETFAIALEHGWDWFSLHADHRMRSVNFFIISMAFLTTAYVTAMRFSHPLSGLGVCVVGLLLTVCFSRFDLRIRELISASESALKPLQGQLARRTGITPFTMFQLVESGNRPFTRYSQVILALHLTAIIMFAIGGAYAIYAHRTGTGTPDICV
jgi:hypothetical protein